MADGIANRFITSGYNRDLPGQMVAPRDGQAVVSMLSNPANFILGPGYPPHQQPK